MHSVIFGLVDLMTLCQLKSKAKQLQNTHGTRMNITNLLTSQLYSRIFKAFEQVYSVY